MSLHMVGLEDGRFQSVLYSKEEKSHFCLGANFEVWKYQTNSEHSKVGIKKNLNIG